MSIDNISKLNQLLSRWLGGQVLVRSYLHGQGYSDQHLQKYVNGGWIERIGVGAYKRPKDSVEWHAGLQAIQEQLKLPIHVGGRTALSLSGKAQYMELGKMNLILFAPRKCSLPAWFKKYPWAVTVKFQESSLFSESLNEFGQKENGFTQRDFGQQSIIMSSPERAILEYIDKLPSKGTYEEALQLMENLTSLRPGVVQALLAKCNSVKAKRLFLHLAEKVGHQWFHKLEVDKVELGTGKRVIFKNGMLDIKYNITVPKESHEEQSL